MSFEGRGFVSVGALRGMRLSSPSRMAMSPLVVEVQPTTGKNLVAFPMVSEISTFNGDIASRIDGKELKTQNCRL